MNQYIRAKLQDDSSCDEDQKATQGGEDNEVILGSTWRIAIVSTFTADLIVPALQFWTKTLEISADITLAPYGQVMQELLGPASAVPQRRRGFNILLVRLEDWIRYRLERDTEENVAHILRATDEFSAALGTVQERTGAETLLYLCPSSSSLSSVYREPIDNIQRDLAALLRTIDGVQCWTHDDVVKLYPIAVHEDAVADRMGHIPYSRDYFVALATLFARHIATTVKPKYKVIAIDCDNTLWKGICGEDGAAGVQLTRAHFEFQELLVRQHDAGVLLCLCSKNNPTDVAAVFKAHPEMPLREEHLVASRVNWNAKSSNLVSLSKELGLSVDTFIFVDDSPMECSEVQSRCPGVLTLQFPTTSEQITHFLLHVWAFDRTGATDEAKRRTAQYKQNRARAQALEQATTTEQFLASLNLEVKISPMQAEHVTRVAELIARTNQFNLTTVRRGATEIKSAWASGELRILVIHVRDRFGDYGLVGASFFSCKHSCLDVDTFVLSCRVLGRGVEHQVVRELGRIAQAEGIPTVLLKYRKTSRNAPAWAFLRQSFAPFRVQTNSNEFAAGETVFEIPVGYVENPCQEFVVSKGRTEELAPVLSDGGAVSFASNSWHERALQLSRLSDIVQAINRATSPHSQKEFEFVAPRSPTEVAVAEIWEDVLGLKKVSVCANFLELGGDSLLAVQAIARIASVLCLELSISEFFEAPTVEKLASKLASASQSAFQIQPTTETSSVPLSLAQQRLWFIHELEGGSTAYHIPLFARLHGQLDETALRRTLQTLVERHEALRTVFLKEYGSPLQEVVPGVGAAIQMVDLTVVESDRKECEVLRQSQDALAEPFDLSAGPLMKFRLLKLSDQEHVLLVTMHHIISDGWSIGVLVRELGLLYEAYRAGQENPLTPLPIQYSDYVRWQREWLAGTEPRQHLNYWREHLDGAPELLHLPTDRPRPPVQSYRGGSVGLYIGRDLAADLRDLSRRFNLTLAMTLFAGWAIALSKLSGQEDIVVGMPVANRRHTELEGLIGFFANTLALRVQPAEDCQVTELLQRVKQTMLAAYTHQDAPFEQVVEALQPERTLSYNPVFQVMFAFQNAPRGAMQLAGLTLVEQDVPLETAQFDLLLSLQERGDEICGTLNYATDLFDIATIERWVECLRNVLYGIAKHPECHIRSLSVMSDDDRRRVTELFNATKASLPLQKVVFELFRDQARLTPGVVAVEYEGRRLTYDELNRKANQLARYLRGKGIGPDQLVGICVERSLDMVVGLLGTLKAGGAYVPLDPHYPAERLQYMLQSSSPKVVLTQEKLKAFVSAMHSEVIVLDAQMSEIEQRYADTDMEAAELGLTAENLVYVIYTSGSTGQPKGTAMPHRAMVNLMQWHRQSFPLREGQRVLQFAALSFDVAFQETFSTLCGGGTLVLLDEWVRRDARALLELLSSHAVERLFVPPLMLQALAECFRNTNAGPRHLQDIITAGEQLRISPEIVNFVKHLDGCRLHNHYGPTETHVVTALTLSGDPEQWPAAPTIGRPIANTQIYILDRHRQPVPIGVAGEIYIGGENVARGYLNRASLTEERFVADPFGAEPQARLYKTGDTGRWRVDGTIEYLGRNDHQVKIRGYRIELGEIEAHLARHEQVREAAVIVREDTPSEKRLVAYVTQRDQADPSVEALRTYLKSVLPEHMVPSAFVILAHLPLTPSGKLDRRALPAPESAAYASEAYEAPQGPIEAAIAQIWQELLKVERVGRKDNFFALGGHSLLATRVTTHISDLLEVDIPLRMVFEEPTVRGLSECIVEEIATELSMEG